MARVKSKRHGHRRLRAGAFAFVMISSIPLTACSKTRPAPEQGIQPEAPPVQILVAKDIGSFGVKYNYYVVNGSAFPIVALHIGVDEQHGTREIRVPPIGWEESTEVPNPSTVSSPPGWGFETIASEGDSLLGLGWTVDSTGAGEIPGGQALGGFSAIVAQEDTAYERGHWAVYLNSSEQGPYYGVVEPQGTTSVPPSSIQAHQGLVILPNPGRGLIQVEFNLRASGFVAVDIFNVAGRSVRQLARHPATKGRVRWTWDGRDNSGRVAPAGTYFVRIQFPGGQRFAKFAWAR